MSERLRDALTVVAVVAVLLLVLWGVLALRRGRAAGEPPTAPGAGGAEAPRRVVPSSAAKEVPPSEVTAVVGESGVRRSSSRPVTKPTVKEARAPATPAAPVAWAKRQPGAFTPEDLAQCGRGVRVELGKYEAAVGSEFEVEIRMVSPALESCTLVMQYDQGALAVVPGSAVPVGAQFRSGIECYAAEGSGKLVIIQAGTPGSKNLDASVGGTASVVCRMRALRAGVTHLLVLPESSFTNGRGEEETYEVSGGEVGVR